MLKYGCPKCHSAEALQVAVTVWAELIQKDGSDDFETDVTTPDDSSHEWDADSTMRCVACNVSGKAAEFVIKVVRLLVPTSSSNEHYNGGCEAMYLELTSARAELCLRRIEEHKRLKRASDLLEIVYADYSPQWLDPYYGDESLFECFERAVRDGHYGMPDSVSIPASVFKAFESGRMIVDVDAVRYSCDPRYSNATVTSNDISVAVLQKAATH